MVDSLSITLLTVSEILAIGVPVAFLIFFHRKFNVSWKHVLVGAVIFIVFALVLEKLLHTYVLHMNPLTMEWTKNPYLYALYGGLAAGVFEEVGRFIGFRYILRKSHDWKDGISYGIGHGGFESLFIGGLAIGGMLINVFMINSGAMDQTIHATTGDTAVTLRNLKNYLINSPSIDFLLGGLERVFSFAFHLGASVLVLYAVRSKKIIFLFVAILTHAAIDFVAGLSGQLKFNVFLVEGFLCLVAVISVIFIIKSKRFVF